MVFLGTSPNAAPAMYALMSHVDLTQGVFYPLGGLSAVAQGWVTLLVVLVGVAIGHLMYRGEISFEQPHTTNPIVYIGRNDLLADKFNDAVFVRGGGKAAAGVAAVDDLLVDGGVRSTATLATSLGGALGKLENGYTRSYGLTMVIGVVVVGAVLILGRLA